MEKWTTANIPDMSGKIIIITGANSGLGYESSKALAEKGAEIIFACRSEEKANKAMSELRNSIPEAKLEYMPLDLSNLQSIRAFAKLFGEKYDKLDILMNNAGIMQVPYGKTVDGFERQFGTNHLGHFALTGLLIDYIKKTPNSRVVTMSSGAHTMANIDFDNLQYEGGKGYNSMTAYGRSKLANLLFTYALQEKFESENISAISLAAHPGGANTNLNNHLDKGILNKITKSLMDNMMQSAEMGALPILRAATAIDAKGGEYYGPDGFTGNSGHPKVVKSSKRSHNRDYQNRLWKISEELTGVRY